MRVLLDPKTKQGESRSLSANLLLLENVRNRPNSTSSYTFGVGSTSNMRQNLNVSTLNGKLSVGSRNDRPLSATPSMVAGGRRYTFLILNAILVKKQLALQ